MPFTYLAERPDRALACIAKYSRYLDNKEKISSAWIDSYWERYDEKRVVTGLSCAHLWSRLIEWDGQRLEFVFRCPLCTFLLGNRRHRHLIIVLLLRVPWYDSARLDKALHCIRRLLIWLFFKFYYNLLTKITFPQPPFIVFRLFLWSSLLVTGATVQCYQRVVNIKKRNRKFQNRSWIWPGRIATYQESSRKVRSRTHGRQRLTKSLCKDWIF